MQLNIELTENDLKRLVIIELSAKLNCVLKEEDVVRFN